MTRELVDLLNTAGVETQACLFPTFENDELRRFADAPVCVQNTCEIVDSAFSLARRLRDDLTWIIPQAPFGLEHTRDWAVAVAQSVGKDEGRKAVERAYEESQAKLKKAAQPLAGQRILFVADAAYSSFLFTPSQVKGIALFDVVRELGMTAEILLRVPPTSEVPHELEESLPHYPDFTLRTGATTEHIEALLLKSSATYIFTSRERNESALRNHKLPVSPRTFQMGFQGFVRTAENLVRLQRSFLGADLECIEGVEQ